MSAKENTPEVFADYLAALSDPLQRERMSEVLNWVMMNYPGLSAKIGWNQPMFTDHGTYIIGFSIAKHHLACSPEKAGIDHFDQIILDAGFTHTANLIRFPFAEPFDYELLKKLIDFNITEKAGCQTFWRQ